MQNAVISFIGGGNMATSLLGGLIADGYDPEKLWVTDKREEQLSRLQQSFGIQTTADNSQAAAKADIVVLAVKPQILRDVLQEIASTVQQRSPLIMSIAAGATIQTIKHFLATNLPIVRCMPNTPALIKAGATGLFANEFVSEEQKQWAESIMRAVGITLWLDQESQMDTVTALSGSGPAYFFYIMEILEKAAVDLNLDSQTARLLTLQTALGAARLALESNVDVAELRRRVTSPGGTTESALEVLIQHKLPEHFFEALVAAQQRSREISQMLDEE